MEETAIEIKLLPKVEITYPDGTAVPIGPAQIKDSAKLRSHFVLLYSHWIERGFATRDLVASKDGWKLLQELGDMHPSARDGQTAILKLEAIRRDFSQIERLFFSSEWEISPRLVEVPLTALGIEAEGGCDMVFWQIQQATTFETAELLALNGYRNIGPLFLQEGDRVYRDRVQRRELAKLKRSYKSKSNGE